MNINKNIERDIYDFMKSNPDALPQIVRHYKLIKKTFFNNDNILKINQRPLASENYSKTITVDITKFINFQEILNRLSTFDSVQLLQNNTIEILVNESNLGDILNIRSIFVEAKDKNNNVSILETIEYIIGKVDDAIASIHANIDYHNLFHTKSLNVKNDNRSNRLPGLTYDSDKKWSSIEEFKNYIDVEEQKAVNDYKEKFLDIDFTSAEIKRLNEVVNYYSTNQADHMYLRLAPYTDEEMTYDEWRDYLVDRYIKINSPDYYQMISNEYPKTLNNIIQSSELPTYSDIIAYANKKHKRLINLEK